MLTTNDVTKVYDTILSIPGMNEMVKLDFKISRRNILLLNSVIERVLGKKEDNKSSGLLEMVPENSLQELKDFSANCMQKAGLVELNEKLLGFSNGK